jgi:two-component system, sensor histidine kinase and response regulator
MMSIINALLTLAGVSNQAQPALEIVDMAAIVQQVLHVRLAYPIAEHQAEIELPEQWPLIHSYSPWIEEVWANYLSNGIKYGGAPPKLTLGAEKIEGNKVKFWVKDNGNGLAKNEQSRLFLPFTRLHHHSVEGHGLGLSIVKKIAEKLGGEAGVMSEINQGSLFYFILPHHTG